MCACSIVAAREYKGSVVLRHDDDNNNNRRHLMKGMTKTAMSNPLTKNKNPGKGGSNNSKKGKVMNKMGILVGELSSTDLEILDCNATAVVIQGVGSVNIVKGIIFIFVGNAGDLNLCSFCNPLFRKVTSITTVASSGITTLTTTFATMGELFDKTLLNPISKDVLLEPLVGCAHSSINIFDRTSKIENSSVRVNEEVNVVNFVMSDEEALECPVPSAISAGSCASYWLTKNPDGRCTFTNCFVGPFGDPVDCFECADLCDNGCGKAESTFLNTDGDFVAFDFGPACCDHDFCWSSNTFSKTQCDFAFYSQMMSQCVFDTGITIFGLPLTIGKPLQSHCSVLATAFYIAVSLSFDAYDSSQRCQKQYEETDYRCIAQCPTTQTSGGQGVQVLSIDMLSNSGSFPIDYEMYDIPDELFVVYEGIRIFETDGLVSNSDSVNVSFSGESTIIQVTINAPNEGTIWDVFVGCPE